MPKPRVGSQLFSPPAQSGAAVSAIYQGYSKSGLGMGLNALAEGVRGARAREEAKKENALNREATLERERIQQAGQTERTAMIQRRMMAEKQADFFKELQAKIDLRDHELNQLNALRGQFEARGVDTSQIDQQIQDRQASMPAMLERLMMAGAGAKKYAPDVSLRETPESVEGIARQSSLIEAEIDRTKALIRRADKVGGKYTNQRKQADIARYEDHLAMLTQKKQALKSRGDALKLRADKAAAAAQRSKDKRALMRLVKKGVPKEARGEAEAYIDDALEAGHSESTITAALNARWIPPKDRETPEEKIARLERERELENASPVLNPPPKTPQQIARGERELEEARQGEGLPSKLDPEKPKVTGGTLQPDRIAKDITDRLRESMGGGSEWETGEFKGGGKGLPGGVRFDETMKDLTREYSGQALIIGSLSALPPKNISEEMFRVGVEKMLTELGENPTWEDRKSAAEALWEQLPKRLKENPEASRAMEARIAEALGL